MIFDYLKVLPIYFKVTHCTQLHKYITHNNISTYLEIKIISNNSSQITRLLIE